MPAIEAMGDNTYFLTLSRPNVPASKLAAEIKYYLKCASLINRYLREKSVFKRNRYNSQPTFSSLRKIECTYNEVTNRYHPHFHFIFDSELAAELFLSKWLERNPTAELNHGNQLKKADSGSAMELFKYFTKVVSKTKNGKSGDYRIHVAALDVMFVAMRAVRTFQPCGVIKAVSEEVEPEQAEASGRDETNFWQWTGGDWMNPETAELLTNWVPSAGIQDIKNHLVMPVDPLAPVSFGPLPESDFSAEQLGPLLPVDYALEPKNRGTLAAAPVAPVVYQSTFFEGLASAVRLLRCPCPEASARLVDAGRSTNTTKPVPAGGSSSFHSGGGKKPMVRPNLDL